VRARRGKKNAHVKTHENLKKNARCINAKCSRKTAVAARTSGVGRVHESDKMTHSPQTLMESGPPLQPSPLQPSPCDGSLSVPHFSWAASGARRMRV
jgi:hypothetical protein